MSMPTYGSQWMSYGFGYSFSSVLAILIHAPGGVVLIVVLSLGAEPAVGRYNGHHMVPNIRRWVVFATK